MYRYKFFMKTGAVVEVENEWASPSTLESFLNDRSTFLKVGDEIFAKDDISHIENMKNMEE